MKQKEHHARQSLFDRLEPISVLEDEAKRQREGSPAKAGCEKVCVAIFPPAKSGGKQELAEANREQSSLWERLRPIDAEQAFEEDAGLKKTWRCAP